jgi:hypothetical protein
MIFATSAFQLTQALQRFPKVIRIISSKTTRTCTGAQFQHSTARKSSKMRPCRPEARRVFGAVKNAQPYDLRGFVFHKSDTVASTEV